MEVKLVVVSEAQSGREIPVVGAKYVIGRGEGCQLRLQSSLASRKHCAILVENDVVAVEDFGSTNGTFLNEERITGRHVLKNGDRLRIGALSVELRIPVPQASIPKSKVAGIQKSVHAVAQTPAAGDDFDVASLFGEEPADPEAFASQSTLALGGDTVAGKSMFDTSALPKMPQHTPQKEGGSPRESTAEPPKSAVMNSSAKSAKSKAPPPKADSSRQAADEALRRMLNRRK
jgi:pSer/pThr/pTyr-binding forkhead associated (FHA) protein